LRGVGWPISARKSRANKRLYTAPVCAKLAGPTVLVPHRLRWDRHQGGPPFMVGLDEMGTPQLCCGTGVVYDGEVAERSKASVSKTDVPFGHPGFESQPLRHDKDSLDHSLRVFLRRLWGGYKQVPHSSAVGMVGKGLRAVGRLCPTAS
jgi:hypothetical protein